jgi:ribonuclease R
MPSKHRTGLPTREQVLEFIETSDQPAGKREIAKAFGLSGADKIALKQLLRDMGDEGLIEAAPGRAFHKLGGVPKVTVLRVVDVDDGGNVWAMPERWESDAPEPRLRVLERGRRGALAVGRPRARPHRGEGQRPRRPSDEEADEGLRACPRRRSPGRRAPLAAPRRQAGTARAADLRLGKAEVGDLVLAEKTGRPPRLSARVDAVLGDPVRPRSFSLIAIHKHGIPHEFSEGCSRRRSGWPVSTSARART